MSATASSTKSELPALAPWPARLFVEVSTRCNLRCPMCVKQSPGYDTVDEDIAPEVFERLIPAFPHLEALILTGIGEPLLHPRLDEFIRIARATLPASSWVGFQTNGRLLNRARADRLVAAGLSRICVSADGAEASTFRTMRAGSEIGDFHRAMNALRDAKNAVGSASPETGVEFVVTADNMNELPGVISMAADLGATFAIVSHVLPYAPQAASLTAWDPNLDASAEFFARWREKAKREGIDLDRYLEVAFRFAYGRSPEEQRINDFVTAMRRAALRESVPLHLGNLMQSDGSRAERLEAVFIEAEAVAKSRGMRLDLPAARPRAVRRCSAVDQGATYVSVTGEVHPCYFLWHGYGCYLDDMPKRVGAVSFGNALARDILDIWNDPEYAAFRVEASGYGYPYCGSCMAGPCADVRRDDFTTDCQGSSVPCGHCPWCLGLMRCLGGEERS